MANRPRQHNDYVNCVCHGKSRLHAALDVASGKVIGSLTQQPRRRLIQRHPRLPMPTPHAQPPLFTAQ